MNAYFTQTRSEYYNLVNLSHLLQKVIDTRSLDHIDVVPVVLDFNRYDVVGLLYRLCAWVQCDDNSIYTGERTLKLLCTNVSSRSSTRHLRPACCGASGGSSGRGTPS